MYNEQIEGLISAALADGVLTEKEKQILFKKAQSQGIDLDEFEMVLDARLVELQKAEKEKAEKSAPKSTKFGDVRKCPVCGALVPALAGVCPECGYEFSGVEANLSSKKLAEKLEETIEAKHANIIRQFPIPIAKADLFEFAITMKTSSEDKELNRMPMRRPIAEAYKVKYDECIAKIKLLYPNDPKFSQILADYENGKKINLGNIMKFMGEHKLLSGCLGFAFIYLIIMAVAGFILHNIW